MAIGYLDMPPALQWREHHEQVGRSIALVFVIISGGPSWLGRDGNTRFGDKLLGGLVDADHGTFGVMRPLINVQYVFHRRHELSAVVSGKCTLLFQKRLENVLCLF